MGMPRSAAAEEAAAGTLRSVEPVAVVVIMEDSRVGSPPTCRSGLGRGAALATADESMEIAGDDMGVCGLA